MSTPNGELRGSQKLLQQLAKNGEIPSVDAIKKAFNLPDIAKVTNWMNKGTPAWLEMEATLETPVSQLGALVDRLVKLNDSSINLKVLINGIPIPDIAHVIVRNTPGEL